MIRLNKWKKIAAACLAALCLTGCGGQSVADAVVVGKTEAETASATEVWAGVQDYAETNDTLAGRYTVEEDAEASFKEAAKAGAKTIIVMGSDLNTAFYKAQYKYKKVKFIGLDAQPKETEDEEAEIAENTVCVTYDKKQLGFLAGYAAVYAGNTSLGFIGGTESTEAKDYLNGFAAGADEAAKALGSADGSITINAWFAGSDELSPVVMDKALSFYDGGAQVILSQGSSISKAVNEAAKKRGKYFISAGCDLSTEDDQCLIGMARNVGETAKSLLKQASSEDFTGGSYKACGAAENSISLVCKYDQLGSFTEEIYKSIYASLSEGQVTISDNASDGTTKVTVSRS
jgi:basic membrane protein A and related proteins